LVNPYKAGNHDQCFIQHSTFQSSQLNYQFVTFYYIQCSSWKLFSLNYVICFQDKGAFPVLQGICLCGHTCSLVKTRTGEAKGPSRVNFDIKYMYTF